MCNHKWKILVSYRHPYLISKTVVCKQCEFCKEKKIDNQFSPSGIFVFAGNLVKHKNKVYKKSIKKIA